MSDNSKHIIDIISDTVASLRKTNTVSLTVLLSGYSYILLLDSVNEYAIGDYITLSDETNTYTNCKVTAINSDYEIVILNLDNTAISNITTATGNAPYFSYDHWLSEANELLQKDQAVKHRDQKYPLVFMLLNVREDRTAYNANKSVITNLNLYLIDETIPAKDAEWRHETNYTRLRQLYTDFIAALATNTYINVSQNYIPHNYEELFYLGTEDRNQNKVNDYVDAIHLELTQLKIKKILTC